MSRMKVLAGKNSKVASHNWMKTFQPLNSKKYPQKKPVKLRSNLQRYAN